MTGAGNDSQGQARKPPVIAGYELLAKLGQGAVGTVYKARQVSLGRIVALKVLDTKHAANKRYVARFLREAQAAGNLNHVNIIQGIDAGKSPEGYYYFAMEFVEGETLKQILRRDHIIPEARAIEIVSQIAQGLRHASRINLVHRDIKPENIIITPGNIAKLADLGLAKTSVEDASITIAGQAMGTPLYISPEQAEGRENIDGRADIYSLGATLYHIATGFPPFTGENPTVTMLKHINEDPLPPREANPQLSPDLSNVILKMMAKAPADRYQTATELIDELSAITAGKSPKLARNFAQETLVSRQPAAAASTTTRSRKPIIAIAAVLIAAAVFGAYSIATKPAKPPGSDSDQNAGSSEQLDMRLALVRLERDQKAFDDLGKQVAELRDNHQYPAAIEAIEAFKPSTRHRIVKNQAEELRAEIETLRKRVDSEAFAVVAARAARFIEKGDHAAAIDLISEFKPETRNADVRAQAESLIARLNSEAYALLEQNVSKHLDKHDYQWAIALVTTFLGLDLNDQTRASAEQLRTKLRDQRGVYVAEQEKIGHMHVAQHRFNAARAIAAELKTQNSLKMSAELLRAIDKAEGEWLEKGRTIHKQLFCEIADRLGSQGIESARKYAATALEDPRNEAAAGEIAWDIALLDRLLQIDPDAHAALKSLEGREFPLHGATLLPIVEVTGEEYVCRISGQPIRRRFSELPHAARFRLAQHHWQQTGKEDVGITAAAYNLYVAGKTDEATEAAAELADDDRQRFARRIEAVAIETEARGVVEQLLAADSLRDWQKAFDACDRLQNDYAATVTVRNRTEQIDDLRRRAQLHQYAALIPAKLCGSAEMLDNGQWRFKWNFSRLDHLGDFEHVKAPPGYRTIVPEIRGGILMMRGIGIAAPVVFRGSPIRIEYKVSLVTEAAIAGYGAILIHNLPQTRENCWEFAVCHGDARRDMPDFFRSIYTIGRSANDCWRRDHPKGRIERRKWYTVQIEISETTARVSFDGSIVYDSPAVKLPGGEPDPAAVPDITQPFGIKFLGWDPADTWAFDDITITGNVDPEWLKSKAAEPEQ